MISAICMRRGLTWTPSSSSSSLRLINTAPSQTTSTQMATTIPPTATANTVPNAESSTPLMMTRAGDGRTNQVSYLCTLRINRGPASPWNHRLISLHPGDTVILGRVSKNQKTEFTAKATNGYFDNPIISRRHALLQNRSGLVQALPPFVGMLILLTWAAGVCD